MPRNAICTASLSGSGWAPRTASLRGDQLEDITAELSRFTGNAVYAEQSLNSWRAVFGGIPYYLKELDPSSDLPAAILRSALYPDGLLREEPRFLLSQESRLRDTDTYMSCLRAIATGGKGQARARGP